MQLLSDSEEYSIANQMLVLLLLHHQFNKHLNILQDRRDGPTLTRNRWLL